MEDRSHPDGSSTSINNLCTDEHKHAQLANGHQRALCAGADEHGSGSTRQSKVLPKRIQVSVAQRQKMELAVEIMDRAVKHLNDLGFGLYKKKGGYCETGWQRIVIGTKTSGVSILPNK